MRVLVCGGRYYEDEQRVFEALDELSGVSEVIEGGAKGADFFAKSWAKIRNIPRRTFPADWDRLGKAAGYIRNKQMLEEGKPDLVVAFPGGKGTANMIKLAREANVEVIEIV